MEMIFLLIVGLVVYFWIKQDARKSPERQVPLARNSSTSGVRGAWAGSGGRLSAETIRVADYETVLIAAVASGGRVELIYVDKDGNRTTRIVKPLEIFDYDYGEGLMRCVRAHCQLRRAERTFAIFRIKSLRRL